MAITTGERAPDFKLPDQDGKERTLKSFKGKWLVLYFYPKDDTPGCTIEGIEFTARKAEFDKLGAVVVGVSGDSGASHCEFIEKHKLSLTLLTDAEKEMMERYDAFRMKLLYGKSFLGIVRSTVLIDPQGVVRHHWKSVKAKDHAASVVKKLTELQK